MGYLSNRALAGLKAYQYKATGYTMLDNLHRPFLDWAASKLPKWLAPNLITLAGTFALIASYLAAAYYAPDFDGDVPRWVPLFSAFAVVSYTILDCLDGKQARRTGTSSPLGQLFDHGCDALSVNLLLASIACSLSMGCGWAHALGNLGVMFIWILAQWEEYHTSLMLYGNEYYGVLECNYTLALVHLVTFVLGQEFWRAPLTKFVPAAAGVKYLGEWRMNEVTIIAMITLGSYQALGNIKRVYSSDPADIPAKERGNKQLGKGPATAHFIVIAMTLAMGSIWLWKPCDQLYQCRAQNAAFGLVYALMASQLIMAHMCKEPFQPPLWAIATMSVAVVNNVLKIYDPFVVNLAVAAVVFFGYLHYVLCVINQICDYLDIYCLTIKHKPAKE